MFNYKDFYFPLDVSSFTVGLNEKGRIKEAMLQRKMTANDIINIETSEHGYTVWYKRDYTLLDSKDPQYPNSR